MYARLFIVKAGTLKTYWLIGLSVYYTGRICVDAVFKQLFSKPTRPWVDQKIRGWSKKVLDLIGVNCTVINPFGVAPKPGQPTLIMCNHSSLYDIPISFRAFPEQSIRMLAKKELYSIPFMGKAMVASEFPSVDRKNRKQAIQDLDYARRLMESGIVMWMAPEGTRSKDGKLAPFKKGAFITAIEAKATIIPIGIRGAHAILPAKSTHLSLNENAEIHVGQSIDASQYSLKDKELLIEKVHQEMKKLIGEA